MQSTATELERTFIVLRFMRRKQEPLFLKLLFQSELNNSTSLAGERF